MIIHFSLQVTLHVSVWVEIISSAEYTPCFRVTLHVSVWVEMHRTCKNNSSIPSRSTWACELKCKIISTSVDFNGHAPRERVSWNEIIYSFYIGWNGHAPRERVSWNTLSNDILKTRTGHAPRERVSWNFSNNVCSFAPFRHAPRERVSWNDLISCVQSPVLHVTLHVSVWVEIQIRVRQVSWYSSHAPRERVSWNSVKKGVIIMKRRHAPRERVSWNLSSPSASQGHCVTLHVSVWVEIWQVGQFH